MRRVTELPVAVREIENMWVPVRDGVQLAARVWLPETAATAPVPAVLEYIPYRKRDMTALRDGATHGYLAGHGYACVRLDVRGVGDSEGVYGDQFTTQYVEDAIDAIAWIARQPWCNRDVAMFGLSWGAAIALQTAARRPPALRTIICAAGIDDRYALRYPGGCLTTATLSSIVAQISYAARPPDPAIVGQRWREMWLARLASVRPMTESWLGHPRRDDAWRSASIDHSAIACPVLLSAGWADPAFASAMLRTLGRLEAPRLGIFGPWAHRYPHLGIPGPAIGYLQETLRWLEHWLKGRETGVMAEPMLRAWLPTGFTVSPTPEDRPGRWIAESLGSVVEPTGWWLGRSGLTPSPQTGYRVELSSALLMGSGAGEFMPIFSSERGSELAGDQRADDRHSLVFDGAPLEEPMEVIGIPSVSLDLETSKPAGQIVVRLCEVATDGRSRRLSWGARNLALTDDFAAQRSSGSVRFTVNIPLFALADTIARGNRLRIAISTSYWPMLWPSASAGRIVLDTGQCRILLPLRAPRSNGGVAMGEPQAAPSYTWTAVQAGGYRREAATDPRTGEHTLTVTEDMGIGRIEEIGVTLSESTMRTFRVRPDDPASAVLETRMSCRFARGDWSAETSARGRIGVANGGLLAVHGLEAREGEHIVYARDWRQSVPSG